MKKKILLLLILLSIQIALFAQSYPLGDTNQDNLVNIIDALRIAQYYVGLNPPNFEYGLADVNDSNDVDIIDALLIAQYYVGLIAELPGTQPGGCPASGNISYTLTRANNPTADQQEAYNLITEAMDTAVEYYNCHTNLQKNINASYNPSVATADGNINGSIRFGSRASMNYITAMHEVSHTLGIGTHYRWSSLIINGIYTGTNATNELRAITGDSNAEIHGDTQHFWPNGLNYTSEVSGPEDLINHCNIVEAMVQDLNN